MAEDNQINKFLEGKTIEKCLKNGETLIIQTSDGHLVHIGWVDPNDKPIKGEPKFVRQDVKIFLPGLETKFWQGQLR